MQTLDEAKQHLDEKKEELNSLEGNDKYQALMEYGDELGAYPGELLVDDFKVPGCTSGVYIAPEIKEGRVYYKGRSESVVVKGYVALLVNALSGLTPEEILGSEEVISNFVEGTNVKAQLTPQRANAFGNVYKMMREQAQTFKNS